MILVNYKFKNYSLPKSLKKHFKILMRKKNKKSWLENKKSFKIQFKI